MFGRFKTFTLAVAVLGTMLMVPAGQAAGNRIVIGKISENPAKQLPRLKAMADALTIALKPFGIEGVDVRVVENEQDAENAMRSGQIDMISETVFGALNLERAGVGEITLAEWKSGKREYHTVFFAKKGSAEGLEGLRGQRLAFQEEGSTSGYYLPRYTMERQGFRLVRDGQSAASGDVRYMFAGEDEINVVVAVARGQAYAGTLSNLDWEDDETVPPALKSRLVIIHKTAPILRSVTVLRTGMDPVIRRKLVDILAGMGDDPAAKDTLKQYFKVKKFQTIGPNEEAVLAGARELVQVGG